MRAQASLRQRVQFQGLIQASLLPAQGNTTMQNHRNTPNSAISSSLPTSPDDLSRLFREQPHLFAAISAQVHQQLQQQQNGAQQQQVHAQHGQIHAQMPSQQL